jgi:uncharacterized protein (TIGR02001 family)
MKKRLIILTGLLMVAFCGLVFAEEPASDEEAWNDPKNISGTVLLTTDYVFRGVSNSDNEPAVQGSLDYTFKGFYVGIWGSNTDFSDAGIEIDYYGGYSGEIGNFGYDLMAIYYSYPDSGANPSLNYFEAHLGLTYKFAGVFLEPTIGAGYNFSPDYSGEDGLGHYGNGTLDLALPYEFTLGGEIGYQYVEGDDTTGGNMGMNGNDGYDYWHWRVSFTKDIPKWFTLDLSYHNTDSDAQNFFSDIADPRLVFTISRTF